MLYLILDDSKILKRGKQMDAVGYVHDPVSGRKVTQLAAERRIKIGKTHYQFVDAGWMNVNGLGPQHVVFSRKGHAPHVLGIVTDDRRVSTEGIVRTYVERWSIEVFFKDGKQLLGLGQYQNGMYRAAVTHLHLVCFAYAVLTHLRMQGEKGKRKRTRVAKLSTSEVQNLLRRLAWHDLVAYLEEQPSGTSFVKELERLFVA